MTKATPLSSARRAYLRSAARASAAIVAAICLPSIAQSPDAAASILGRWDLSFIRKDGDFHTVWLFALTANNKLTAATIGPNQFGLSLSDLNINGREFTFKGTSALGSVQLRGTLNGDHIVGTWEAGSESGQLIAKKRSDVLGIPFTALFDRTIEKLEAELFTTNLFNDEWRLAKRKSA